MITGDELIELLAEDDVVLVDVRTREEYLGTGGYPCDPYQGHIPGAVHLDLDDVYAVGGDPEAIRGLLVERGIGADSRVVTYCHSGQRSEMAAVILGAAGVEAVNYPGSWHEWSRRAPAP